MIRILAPTAVWAFPLHWLWETAHGVAYVQTRLPLFTRLWHCLPMAIIDVGWTAALVAAGLALAAATRQAAMRWWGATALGIVTAVGLEMWAIGQRRWSYNELMPVLPFVRVGLWPVLQMALVPAAALWLAERRVR